MAHLITGYAGEEHIQSADQGSFNASFFGTGEYVMEAGNQFEASVMDNNTVRIFDGDILMQGRHIRIEPNTYEDITISTGTAGVNRNDLICMQYTKDAASGVESAEIVVVKGTETEGTASDPAHTTGDILSGATSNQMPLYRVKIEGVVLAGVEPLFDTIPTFQALAERYRKEFEAACESHLDSLNVLDTMEEVEANTQSNQLAGALAVKELNTTLQTDLEEIRGVTLTGTLTAGETTLALADASITENSSIDVYTSVYGVNPTAITVASRTMTLTFDAQEADVNVKVRCF